MKDPLLQGDPMDPAAGDLIAQTDIIRVGEPVPCGWRVLSGNHHVSEIGRIAMRYEIEEED